MIILLAFTSTFTSASGIGGGAINSVLLMYLNNFSPKKAFSISNFIILSSSIAVFYIGIKIKEEDPNYSFVDYDVILVFVPMLAIGGKIGQALLMIFPAIFLDILLFVNIIYGIISYFLK